MSIADNLRRVRKRIAVAAEKSGRTADNVTLVGVTKYVGTAEAAELLATGCFDLGESRPQELWTKAEAIAAPPAGSLRWHMIGHLQCNKVRRTLPHVSLIHSVDSEQLLATIDAEWQTFSAAQASLPPPQRVLLEVNTSGESAKHGLQPAEVAPILATAGGFPHVVICGLMTMAALDGDLTVAARNFAALRELREQLRPQFSGNVALDELSMGMSGDFEVAIHEGATIVRVGSALWEGCEM